jgi:hypothetical protein
MTRPINRTCLLSLTFACLTATAHPVLAGGLSQQNASSAPDGLKLDPMKYLTDNFPDTVALKQNGHLLEFCPDNTCHGFASSANVSVATLKDFAYLYIYYFSEYIYLSDWRGHPTAKEAAERILSEPEHHYCKSESDRDTARCVLLDLSRGGKIKLMFIRYDENRRNVVPEHIPKELSRGPTSTQ